MKNPVMFDETHLFASAGSKPGRREPVTVITRLRVKQATPGRAVRRRRARTARRAARNQTPTTTQRLKSWLFESTNPTTRINPARDHRSRKSGRLRKELR